MSTLSLEKRIAKVIPFTAPGRRSPKPLVDDELGYHDINNLRRVVWLIGSQFRREQPASTAVWKAIRRVTGVPPSQPFRVSHLPVIAAELRRCWAYMSACADVIKEAEAMVIRRAIRHGEDADALLQVIAEELPGSIEDRAAEFERQLAAFTGPYADEFRCLSDRRPSGWVRPDVGHEPHPQSPYREA